MNHPDRREFLLSFTAAIAGLGTMNLPGQSQNPDAADGPLGQGNYQWRHVPGWGVLDEDTPVKDCHDMVQAKDGRIFLLTTHTKNNVIVYDRAGKLVTKWGTEYPGAHGLTIAEEDGSQFLYITDYTRNQFYKTSLDGEVLRTWNYPEKSGKYTGAGEFKPTHVAIAPDGGFFVADGYGKSWVHRYDDAGEYVSSFGGDQPDGANLLVAHGAWVDTRGATPIIWVTSRTDSKLKRYTLDGALIDIIDVTGALPTYIVPLGDHTVIPQLRGNSGVDGKPNNGFVTILGPDHKIVSNLGAPAPEYQADGKPAPLGAESNFFTYPHGLLIDDEQSIYVAQWNSGNTYPIKLERVKA